MLKKTLLAAVLLLGCDEPKKEINPLSVGVCKDMGVDLGAGSYSSFACPHPDHIASMAQKGYMLCTCTKGDR